MKGIALFASLNLLVLCKFGDNRKNAEASVHSTTQQLCAFKKGTVRRRWIGLEMTIVVFIRVFQKRISWHTTTKKACKTLLCSRHVVIIMAIFSEFQTMGRFYCSLPFEGIQLLLYLNVGRRLLRSKTSFWHWIFIWPAINQWHSLARPHQEQFWVPQFLPDTFFGGRTARSIVIAQKAIVLTVGCIFCCTTFKRYTPFCNIKFWRQGHFWMTIEFYINYM